MQWRTVLGFKHEGRTMLVKRLGPDTGPQFVLVHGIGVASRYFTRLARVLARTGGVHAVELPGFGGAPKPEAPLPLEEHAEILNAYVRSAGLRDAVLVGHSMGGQIVLEAALQEPDLFSLVVTMGGVVDPGARTAFQQGLRLTTDFLLETPPANWAVLRDYVRTGLRWYFRTVPIMLGYKTEESLVRLRTPLLIIRGARDPIVRHDWADQMRRLAPDARLVEVPRAAHVVMYTRPEEVAHEILVSAGLQARALS
ncbi:MAG TPA: alpha/beta hydrolase [Naasia sp.]|jgi:pimeloyl-ACP methyl ester carboxylesterase